MQQVSWLAVLLLLCSGLLSGPTVVVEANNPCEFEMLLFANPLTGSDTRLAPKASSVLTCLRSIPDATINGTTSIRSATIDFLDNALDFYVFHQQNKDSGPPFNLKVDGQAELKKIAERNWTNDYDFHRAIWELFLSFKDGHSEYLLPRAYREFEPIQPLQLTSRMDGNVQKLYVHADFSLGMHDAVYGSDLSEIIGWEVVQIADTDAMEYFKNFTHNQMPLCKDAGVNFNHGLQFSFHAGAPGIIPTQDTLSFLLRDPEKGATQKIEVNYMVFIFNLNGINVTTDKLAAFNDIGPTLTCSTAQRSEEQPQQERTVLEDTIERTSRMRNFFRNQHVMRRRNNNNKNRNLDDVLPGDDDGVNLPFGVFQTAPNSRDFQVIALDNQAKGMWAALYKGEIGVIRLPTFFPLIGGSQLSQMAIDAMFFGIRQAHKLGASKLIVDVRGNAGGLVCAGLIYAQYLLRNDNLFTTTPTAQLAASNFGEYDFRKTPARTRSIGSSQLGLESDWNVATPEATSPVPNRDIYASGDLVYDRGGQNATFSPRYSLDCFPFRALAQVPSPWDVRDIVVLTDGQSISTGSIFMRAIFGGIKVVGMGGIKGQPMDSSFSPGAPVWTSYSSFFQFELCPNMSNILPQPKSAGVRFPFSEIYEHNNNQLVAEFTRLEPNIRLDFWDQDNIAGLYDLTLRTVWSLDIDGDGEPSNDDLRGYDIALIVVAAASLLAALVLFILLIVALVVLRRRGHAGYHHLDN